MPQGKWMDARAGALADDEVYAKIFHGGVEDFFHRGLQAMDFVQKEDFFGFQRGENRGEVAFAFEQRAGAGFDGDLQFVGDDLGQRGFPKTRRAVQQDVIEGFSATACGFDGDRNVFLYALLADVFVKALGADASLDARVFFVGSAGDNSVWLASVWHSFGA